MGVKNFSGKLPMTWPRAWSDEPTFTDGAGSYVLRYVSVKEGEEIAVDISAVRANGRVDRVQSDKVVATLGGATKVSVSTRAQG